MPAAADASYMQRYLFPQMQFISVAATMGRTGHCPTRGMEALLLALLMRTRLHSSSMQQPAACRVSGAAASGGELPAAHAQQRGRWWWRGTHGSRAAKGCARVVDAESLLGAAGGHHMRRAFVSRGKQVRYQRTAYRTVQYSTAGCGTGELWPHGAVQWSSTCR
jgi:hypothetical protein